jgi:hypothetical protein
VQKVLAEPALVTVVGRPAKFVSGAEVGDRIEIDLTVKEAGVRNSPRKKRRFATARGIKHCRPAILRWFVPQRTGRHRVGPLNLRAFY